MRKLKLNLEELTVESFDTASTARGGRGTVLGQEQCTCDDTCADTCYETCREGGTCGGRTCWDTCGYTCAVACGEYWSDAYYNGVCV